MVQWDYYPYKYINLIYIHIYSSIAKTLLVNWQASAAKAPMLTKEEAQKLRQERDPNFKPGIYPNGRSIYRSVVKYALQPYCIIELHYLCHPGTRQPGKQSYGQPA